MAAGVYDFIVEQGIPYTFQAQYKNPDGTPKNLTGWITKGRVKEKINDCNILGELVIDILEPLQGVLGITVPKEIHQNIKIKGTRFNDYGFLVYDITLWPSSDPSDIRRLLNGTIRVSPGVTK
jgi:hypothetical protein